MAIITILGGLNVFDENGGRRVPTLESLIVRIRSFLGSIIRRCVQRVASLPKGTVISDPAIRAAFERTKRVDHNGLSLTLSIPGGYTEFRASTFSSKEPETLEWIDGFTGGEILWDIGANVGLYSCYAAIRGYNVVAVEPSVFNLEILARNIHLNELSHLITIVPVALSQETGPATLNMSSTSTKWGGSLSSFGVEYGFDGSPLDVSFRYRLAGIAMDDLVSSLSFDPPDHVKLDVDGIEHLILKGGRNTLASVQSVLVEVDERFVKQREGTKRCLTEAGLSMVSRQHAAMFDDGPFSHCYNQIWTR